MSQQLGNLVFFVVKMVEFTMVSDRSTKIVVHGNFRQRRTIDLPIAGERALIRFRDCAAIVGFQDCCSDAVGEVGAKRRN
jgi:hypothetical protein